METAQATITSHAILDFSTPTPINYSADTTCAEDGNIEGWGTVTPSALWRLMCESCVVTPFLTSTAPPAPTWDGTGTPPPTGTATPEATSTPAPTLTPQAVNNEFNRADTKLSVSFDYTYEPFCTDCYYDVDCNLWTLTTYRCDIIFSGTSNATDEHYPQAHVVGNLWMGYWRPTDIYYFRHDDVVSNIEITGQVDDGYIGTTEVVMAIPSTNLLASQGQGNFYYRGKLLYSMQNTDPLHIAGTPTPAPLQSMCSSVKGGGDDQIFGFEGIEFGAMRCVDLFEYSVTILGIDINLPMFAHLCFQDVSLGNAYIFGFPIDMDAPLYLLGITWFLRNLFVS